MTTKEIQLLVGKMQVLKFHSPVCENVKYLIGEKELDVMSVSKSQMLYEFEVKISRSDFKADLKKGKFAAYDPANERLAPNYFSYVCPENLIKLAEIPHYAGLYYAKGAHIIEIRKPKRLHTAIHDREKILEKICRVNSERQFLGACRMTYENKKITERFKTYQSEKQQNFDFN